MKIKALTRPSSSIAAPGSTAPRQPRNLDPALHPFERAREYTRALNATKMDRMFAAPLLGDLGRGHVDGVYRMALDPGSLERLASASGDGVIKVWDLPSRGEVWQAKGHENIVKGLCWSQERKLLSCAADRTVKMWDPYAEGAGTKPIATWLGRSAYTSVTHHRTLPSFAVAANSAIHIHDTTRPGSAPSTTIAWPTAVDTISHLTLNQTETSILASCASDRSITLYDLRTNSPLHRTVLTLAANTLAWNPMEAFNLAAASEDHNVYIFDMRRMGRALNVLRDHVAAVMDVAWSPTGTELVTASYDRTIRLWNRENGHSRDVYHTRRMQRVFSASWSADNAYVVSGSDDGSVRLWRARASARQGVKTFAQRQALEYADGLRKRYAHMPEVRRIARHRHVPRTIKKAAEIKGEEVRAIRRREENERRHSRKGEVGRRSEREKMVLAVEE
ncbi:WD40 repeat-like protein [Trichodelitschia bisporula]|uniref:DDB1- and CUL4-associated factor 13 n=1 Tax=Trichodelitschia bisporula TaxID=703511 RepID=A0A6G1I4E5_9PEZI|nr:WD40 repeat-like protein [Trichodelitschia bisporula]